MKILTIFLLIFSISGCSSKSIYHHVENPINFSISEYDFSINQDFNKVNLNTTPEDKYFFIKNGIGHTVANFLLIQRGIGFLEEFYGDTNIQKIKLTRNMEKINDINFISGIYLYDFRFDSKSKLAESIDKITNRSCGVIKVYTNIPASYQIIFGKVGDCAILKMSLANYKTFKISDVIIELNTSAKKTFNVTKN